MACSVDVTSPLWLHRDMTTAATYRVLGTTDDCTTCGICGRDHLKGTVVLDTANGEIYAGTGCAATITGRPVRDIHREARDADKAKREQAIAANIAAAKAETAMFLTWVADTYGVTGATQSSDLWDKVPGMTPFALRKQWRDACR